jgi:carbonic anhydrase
LLYSEVEESGEKTEGLQRDIEQASEASTKLESKMADSQKEIDMLKKHNVRH